MSTSPAASTARPERARTFAARRRVIPAIPIGLRRPPIVEGMKLMKSAVRKVKLRGAPTPERDTVKSDTGRSEAVSRRYTTVSAMRRTESEVSLGVGLRSAPSTMRIMRSTKPPPLAMLGRTTSQSERTVVPLVTLAKSPPDSRMTGADSPVTADSSTDATPATTSPSQGTTSPGRTRTRSFPRSVIESTT